MTPKDKAEQLFQLYLPFVSSIGSTDDIKYRCKQCALIAVDEIIEANPIKFDEDDNCIASYWWIEVKQEIEKL